MQKTHYLAIAIAIVAIAAIAFFLSQRERTPEGGGRYMDVETYVRSNISQLSPVKESLGGTFMVTELSMANGTGTVKYEDGHNAYVADFSYAVDTEGRPDVHSFVVRQ